MTTAKIKSWSEGCFHVKRSILGSEAWYCHHLSLHCCVLFTLFCLSWVGWEASTFVCLFLFHLSDSTEAIEVMTWVLHLGNHFHIPQKRVVMIAFDNRQSKLHHPPRVLLCAILWRKRKRRGRGLRGRDGGSHVWVGWVGGIGERELRQRKEEGKNAKDYVAIKRNKSHQALGVTHVHVIIDSTLKALFMDLLCSHIALYTHYKSQIQMSKCSGHTDTVPIHLGGMDNHKDLLNGAGRSSLYQVLLYRACDKWDCHDGWGWGAEGLITHWIELKPENEPQHWAGPGCHLVWWTPWSCRGGDEWGNAFLLTALNK